LRDSLTLAPQFRGFDLAARHSARLRAHLGDSLTPAPRFPWPSRFAAPQFRSSLGFAAAQPVKAAQRSFPVLPTALSKLLLPYTTGKLQAQQRCQSQLA